MDLLNRLPTIGRLFFAIGLVAFGIQQFVFGDFVPGRAPAWPEGTPGRLAWAWGTGVIFILAGVAIGTGKAARPAAIAAGALIFAWALLRHIPLVAADTFIGGAWTAAGKAIVMIGGLTAAAATFVVSERRKLLLLAGRVSLGAFMILCGFQHFRWETFVVTLVPTWVPGGGVFWTYTSGVLLIAGGLGLLLPWTARLAAGGSGLMIFLWVLMLHLPRALNAAPDNTRNEWTAVVEAFAFSGLAFLLTARGATQAKSVPAAQAPGHKQAWDYP
jgi:uncharacterized membrane protein